MGIREVGGTRVPSEMVRVIRMVVSGETCRDNRCDETVPRHLQITSLRSPTDARTGTCILPKRSDGCLWAVSAP
jgi:hypothetical protein